MSAKNDLASVAADLSVIGKTLAAVADDLIRTAARVKACLPEDCLASVPEGEPPVTEDEKKTWRIEDIRTRLKALIDAGFQAEVKALVKKYADSGTLTGVQPEKYPDLMKEAEKINDW